MSRYVVIATLSDHRPGPTPREIERNLGIPVFTRRLSDTYTGWRGTEVAVRRRHLKRFGRRARLQILMGLDPALNAR